MRTNLIRLCLIISTTFVFTACFQKVDSGLPDVSGFNDDNLGVTSTTTIPAGSSTTTSTTTVLGSSFDPNVSSVSPTSGVEYGGKVITVYGSNFENHKNTKVEVGGIPCAILIKSGSLDISSTQIKCKTEGYFFSDTSTVSSKSVTIKVTNPDGKNGSKSNAFTYNRIGRNDDNCWNNGNFNACIFHKNPVNQNVHFGTGGAFSPAHSYTTNHTDVQTFGVNITDLKDLPTWVCDPSENDCSGYLSNDHFVSFPQLQGFNGSGQAVYADIMDARAQDNGGNWKYPFSLCASASSPTCSADPNHYLSQVTTFYYLNHTKNVLKDRTGGFYAENKEIIVSAFVDGYNNASFSYEKVNVGSGQAKDFIQMGEIGSAEFGIQGLVMAHELGHGNHFHGMTFGDEFNTKVCSGGSGVCCKTKNGCFIGISEGIGDYMAYVVFPKDTGLFELMQNYDGNSQIGYKTCGSIPRNPKYNGGSGGTLKTAQNAYDACGTSMKGEVHAMGVIYASIWWSVRNDPDAIPVEVDSLFTDHIGALHANDTFVGAIKKIRAEDKQNFPPNGKYSAMFDREYTRRGLPLN